MTVLSRGIGWPYQFATYRLSRAALDQRQFFATELAALTGVPLNTMVQFHQRPLGTRLTSEPQASGNVGRRQKLYTLTEEGVDLPTRIAISSLRGC